MVYLHKTRLKDFKYFILQGLGTIVNIWYGNKTLHSAINLTSTEICHEHWIDASEEDFDEDAMISLQSFLGDNFQSDQSERVRIFPVTLASAVRENKLWLIIGNNSIPSDIMPSDKVRIFKYFI